MGPGQACPASWSWWAAGCSRIPSLDWLTLKLPIDEMVCGRQVPKKLCASPHTQYCQHDHHSEESCNRANPAEFCHARRQPPLAGLVKPRVAKCTAAQRQQQHAVCAKGGRECVECSGSGSGSGARASPVQAASSASQSLKTLSCVACAQRCVLLAAKSYLVTRASLTTRACPAPWQVH
jgi:hypothetical protein